MTTEGSSESSAAAPETPAAEVVEQQQQQQQQQPVVEKPKADVKPKAEEKPVVEETPAEEEKPSVFDEPAPPPVEAAMEIELPEILPDDMRGEDTQSEANVVANILSEHFNQAQIDRVMEITAEFALEVKGNHPDLNDRAAIEHQLRQRWGTMYDSQIAAVRFQAQRLGPKFLDWLDQGNGNYIPVIEALAAMGNGTFRLSKEEAQAEMTALRLDPKSALRDPGHVDHTYAVGRARVLAQRIALGDTTAKDRENALKAGFRRAVTAPKTTGRSQASVQHALKESQQAGFRKDTVLASPPTQGEIPTLRAEEAKALREHGRFSTQYRAARAKTTAAYERQYGTEEYSS